MRITRLAREVVIHFELPVFNRSGLVMEYFFVSRSWFEVPETTEKIGGRWGDPGPNWNNVLLRLSYSRTSCVSSSGKGIIPKSNVAQDS